MISSDKKIYTVKEIKEMLSKHGDDEGVQFGWVFHGGEKTKEDRLREMCYDLYHLLERCEICVKEVAEDRYARNRNKNWGRNGDARELKETVDGVLADFAKRMIEIDCIG